MFNSNEKFILLMIKKSEQYTPYLVAKEMGIKFGDEKWAPAMNYVFGGSVSI